MNGKENLFICMGSACHQLGVFEVLPQIQSQLAQYQLESKVELKGAFCLNSCEDGVVIKLRDQLFGNIKPDNVERKFREEIFPYIEQITKE